MTRRILVAGLAALVAAAVAFAAMRARREPSDVAKSAAAPTAMPAASSASADSSTESARAMSLYDLELEHLTDDAGKPVRLDVDRGHPVVVSMFYASCPSACPALMLETKAIDSELPADVRENVRYLLVSFDPARDDVAALAAVRSRHALDGRWTIARTDEREVRQLATVLGLRYRFRDDGEIDHSTNLTLVRPDGGIDVQVDGLSKDKSELVRRLGASS